MPAGLVFTGARVPGSGVIAGDTIVFQRTETTDQAYVFDTAVVSVVGPSGTVSPTVAQLPGTPAVSQMLQSLVNEATAGSYTLNWQMNVGGQIVIRSDRLFVGWIDFQETVRALLRVDAVTVADHDIDMVANQMLQILTGPDMFLNVLPSYLSVAPQDRVTFDTALAYMTAAAIRPFTPKQEAFGDVLTFQSGTDVYRWSPTTTPGQQVPIETQWLDQAWQLFTTTTQIGATMRGIQQGAHIFAANGRRRNKVPPFSILPFGVVQLNPLSNAFINSWSLTAPGLQWSWNGRGPW